MPTADRRCFVPSAIEMFLAQDYGDKELLILDDGRDAVADLVPNHPQVHYTRLKQRTPLGRKRNLACEAARGDVVLHWDDDDWYGPSRIRYQVDALNATGADICGIDRAYFVDSRVRTGWEYVYPRGGAPWLCGATLCYTKAFWRANPFADVNVGEDTRFIFSARGARVHVLDDNRFFVGRIHGSNTSPKRTGDRRWEARPLGTIQALVGEGWPRYFEEAGVPQTRPSRGAALIAAASGIGDIVRITPLIRVAYRLGYAVDVLLAPDDAAAADLLRGAAEIRRLIVSPAAARCDVRPSSLTEAPYDVAIFTTWSARLAAQVRSVKQHTFAQRDWLRDGDSASVAVAARGMGWTGSLPASFVVPSGRRFDLPPDTVALHPGCKPGWPWKKWHGFDELAALFPSVAVIGTPSDLINDRTYFDRPFAWPAHVRNFVGTLSLPDTAALIGQCAALISLDSGLMHVGVALEVPTFGIFGITSPARECIPSPFMVPITKQLPCEPACRQQSWGRRDCQLHLECLRMLTAQEVHARVIGVLPRLTPPAKNRAPSAEPDAISLNYYGEVFDASGYGQAARAYLHAFHAAGVRLHVVNTGANPAQVNDPLVSSLLGNDPEADFNLFHGIPPLWARSAYPLRNVIAMTVWETDRMPHTWRNALTHAIDVWLPCKFNTDVFSRDLGRAVFRLPHPLPVREAAPQNALSAINRLLGIGPNDFVFYGVFEWQDRKNPKGLLECFLRAFPEECDAVLVLKTGGRAADEAHRALEALRSATQSRGRVALHCGSLTDEQLHALHQRGDCYVSLHKGEGWGYPLFEAAARGNPVIATDFAGPVDYLDAAHHWLVRKRLAPVRQPYAFYHPSMKWAEPDTAHAAEGLRWVYENRSAARLRAKDAAQNLESTYSAERIGDVAKDRLLELLRRVNPKRYAAATVRERERKVPSVLPIPGDWYDADYFEHGTKSNWRDGYTWERFRGVFDEAAGYLHEMFPDARDYLDVGCAKGFLVKALRERGLRAQGFDHSQWAIENAETSVKPFLRLASADDVAYEEMEFDILVAMSIFESLTEGQLQQFLQRAKRWVKHGIFATISTVGGLAAAAADRDLSHVTLRDRAWWQDRFVEAGWRHDAIHLAFERACGNHALAKRMGWDVYVLSTGRDLGP